MKKIILLLFVLITVAISIEYKYHNTFRHVSRKLLPVNHVLPKWFDKKILFHPSDWIAPVLFVCVLLAVRKRPPKEVFLCLSLPLLAAISIAASPLAGYPVLYLHLWQYMTGVFLFGAAMMVNRDDALNAVLKTLVAMGTLQSILAIAQYFAQHSFGLRWLGEVQFSEETVLSMPSIWVPDGKLWIWNATGAGKLLARAAGTLSHPNVLGGFLVMTCLATLSVVKRPGVLLLLQLTAMTLTFSRAALFGFVIGFSVWLYCQIEQKKPWKNSLALITASFALILALFHSPITHRGGIVNYNTSAKDSDTVRLVYQNAAIQIIAQKPLFGVGHQQFTLRLPEFLPAGKNPNEYLAATHNIYLLWAAETGLPSLLAYLLFLASIALLGMKQRFASHTPALLGIFLAFLFIGLCDFYLLTFQSGRLMLFLIAGFLANRTSSATDRVVALQRTN